MFLSHSASNPSEKSYQLSFLSTPRIWSWVAEPIGATFLTPVGCSATVIPPRVTPHLPPHSGQTIPFQTHHSSASNRPVLLFPSRLDMLWTPGPSPTSSLTQPTTDTLATLAFCPRVLRQPALAAWNSSPTQETSQMSPS